MTPNKVLASVFACLMSVMTLAMHQDQSTIILPELTSLDHTMQQAWQAMLVRWSGSADIIAQSDALRTTKPAQYLATYHYRPCVSSQHNASRCLQFKFNIPAVKNIFNQLGVHFWSTNRPQVLTWIFVQQHGNAQPMHQFPELVEQYKTISHRRGLALQLPTLDLQDMEQVTDSHGAFAPTLDHIKQASERYHATYVLLGVIDDQHKQSTWMLIDEGDTFKWTNQQDTVSEGLQKGLNHTIDHFVNKDMQHPTQIASQPIQLLIQPVQNLQQMSEIVEHLQHFAALSDIKVKKIEHDSLLLEALRMGDSEAFEARIRKDPKFSLDTETNSPEHALPLRWLSPTH